MRRPAALLIFPLLLSLDGLDAFAADKKSVAVLPFGSPTRWSEMGHNAQPTFITELVKSKQVRVIDEKHADAAAARFAKETSGLYDQTKVRQIGRFLKVDYVLSGQVSHTGDAFTMTVHVTNVETSELEMAEDVDFRDVQKMRVAVRTVAKKIAAVINGEEAKTGKHEAFLNVDARDFYDTAEACVKVLEGLDHWRYEGEIDSEVSAKKVHVKLSAGKPKNGMPLQVFEEGLGENDRPIGVVYVLEPDEAGGGFVAEWIKEKDPLKKKKGDFGLGARVSNARYKYRIALGKLDDEAEDNERLVEMFKDKLVERFEESDKFIAKTESDITEIALDLPKGSAKKNDLKKLHELGVDFLIEGKFIGSPGSRRADFTVISTVTGEVWGRLKFETRI